MDGTGRGTGQLYARDKTADTSRTPLETPPTPRRVPRAAPGPAHTQQGRRTLPFIQQTAHAHSRTGRPQARPAPPAQNEADKRERETHTRDLAQRVRAQPTRHTRRAESVRRPSLAIEHVREAREVAVTRARE
eukprot:911612-Prymnesium_polylepis.1